MLLKSILGDNYKMYLFSRIVFCGKPIIHSSLLQDLLRNYNDLDDVMKSQTLKIIQQSDTKVFNQR